MSSNDRSNRISRLLNSNSSRASYIKAKLGVLVPAQIRSLRLKSDMPRQSDLAKAAAMQQSRISMVETPGAANMTLETLSRIAATLKTGLVVKFVPFHEMLWWENSFSSDTFDVIPRLDNDAKFLNPPADHANFRKFLDGFFQEQKKNTDQPESAPSGEKKPSTSVGNENKDMPDVLFMGKQKNPSWDNQNIGAQGQ